MKKNCYLFCEKVQMRKRKRLFIMKITILLSLLFLFRLSATGYSPQIFLSLSFNDKTVKEVISYHEENNENQQITVRGLVTSGTNDEPLPGVNIIEKGTQNGTTTNENGEYTINIASPDAILVFSFIGYLQEEINVAGQTTLDIKLIEDIQQLDEVIVIGYGVQKKDDLTGSVAVVNAEDIHKSGFTSFDRAIQGKAAGVHVTNVSGLPGAGVSVKVRGLGSITRNSEPLYVIDGFPVEAKPGEASALSIIEPSDIESIQILKDASATAIYGTRGANGVVIITTKKGNSKKPRIEFSTNIGFSNVAKTYDVMDANEYSEFMGLVYEAENLPYERDPYKQYYCDSARIENDNYNTNTNFQDAMTRQGMKQNYNISIGNSSNRSSYYASGSYTTEEGIMVNTGMERFTLRFNSDCQLFDRINIGESFSFGRAFIDEPSHFTNFNSWRIATMSSPLMPLYDENAIGGYGGLSTRFVGNNERTNPVAEQMLNDNENTRNNLISSVYTNVEFLKGLTLQVRLGLNYENNNGTTWSPVYTLGDPEDIDHNLVRDNQVNELMKSNEVRQGMVFNTNLEYLKSIGNHNINAIIGFERTRIKWEDFSVSAQDFEFEYLNVLSQGNIPGAPTGEKGEHRLESYLGRLIYDYKGKYLLTVSLRIDGSSRFGPETDKFGKFPSFSAGWKLNEDLLKTIDKINMLKIRVGWGQTGNENLDDYMFAQLLEPKRNARYTYGIDQAEYTAYSELFSVGNPMIKWEATEMTNFGIDLIAFNNKIEFTAEYYIKNQEDMLVERSISAIHGKYNDPHGWVPTEGAWVNLGHIRNSGLELNLIYKNHEGAFQYDLSGNFSTLKNRVIDLDIPPITTDWTKTMEGHTISSIYGYIAERIIQEDDYYIEEDGDPVYKYAQQFAEPGDIKFKDLNYDGKITTLDMTIIGKPLPDFIYGFNFNATFKNFDLALYLQGVQNVDVYNEIMSYIGVGTDRDNKDNNKLEEVLTDLWTPENPSTTMTRAAKGDPNNNARVSSWFVEDASYLKIRTLQIGYTLPDNILDALGLSGFRVYVNASNLFSLTKYSGYDPEISSVSRTGDFNPLYNGIDLGVYPTPRIFSTGLQLSF